MANGYQPQEIEGKWQARWQEWGTYQAHDLPASEKARKFYGLIEFPFPSGEGLHVGHPRSYTAIDIMTRKQRMMGKNVLYPIGWDAFGLPAENFAIKTKTHPATTTAKNIANFKRQLTSIGLGFDWSREVDTTDPKYYKWTQWMFLKFFNSYFDEVEGRALPIEELAIPSSIQAHGDVAVREYIDAKRMAYKAESTINWCPRCKIGLANEEAQGGVCERCGNDVEQRVKKQWMIRITAYADRLIDDLEEVDYLEKIKAQQINWIGRSKGAYVDFAIHGAQMLPDRLTVFTTRPDTLFGATYVVVAPEHPLVETWMHEGHIQNMEDVRAYQDGTKLKSELQRQEQKEKTGVALKGVSAVNPATGEALPVWMADYVLGGYGTGAIMAVPAHDERDFEFANVFGLPVKQVVAPFIELTGASTPRAGKKTVTRNVATAIIRHATDDRYLLLVDKNGECGFVGGGIESGEDAQAAALREITEETGYTHAEIESVVIPQLWGHGYKAKKDINCFDPDTVFLAKVMDDERVALSAEDQGAHEVIWVSKDEVAQKITKDHHRFMWDWYRSGRACHVGDGVAMDSGFLDGLKTEDAKAKMIEWLEENGTGEAKTTYRLRDWVFSRQRYWGEPIPIILCPECGYIPVPESQLPVVLPQVEEYEPTDTGESPLAAIRSWVEVSCPSCGGDAERETDTMPNWAGSSWYFLRYCDPKNDAAFADPEKLKFWMPVDLYNGGMEHTTLHLLYSRFWYKFLWDLGLVPKECGNEPYRKRRSHALIMGEGGVKMSKSKGNVVNPDDVVVQYGADVFRMYEMFIGPFDQDAPWDTNGIEGVKRFLEKVWKLREHVGEGALPEGVETLLHQTIKKVTDDIEGMHFNTAVSAQMILVNALSDESVLPRDCWELFLKILAPFAPHLTEELWSQLGYADSIHVSPWPAYDPTKLQNSTFELVVQVNGKVRDKLMVEAEISEEDAKARALASEKVQQYLEGKQPQRIVYVKGRLLSIVV